jgi:hypothetical protein
LAVPFCLSGERRASRGREGEEAHMSDDMAPTELNRVTAFHMSVSLPERLLERIGAEYLDDGEFDRRGCDRKRQLLGGGD